MYDPIQWTMTYLLKESINVQYALFASTYFTPSIRILVYFVMECYYWLLSDPVIGINIYAGMIMAELTHSSQVQRYTESRRLTTLTVSSIIIFVGLLATSYPEANVETRTIHVSQWLRVRSLLS